MKLPFYATFVLLVSLSLTVQAQEAAPDFTREAKIPAGHTHDWNLGPTGARGWIYTEGFETTAARQILITKIDGRSPSDGILQKGDVILGIDSDPFSFDPRVELGKAIGVAEAGSGKLKLNVWRSGKTKVLTIRLAKLGQYAETAPFDCKKSKKIYQQGCEVIAKRIASNRRGGDKIVRAINALALLSSGQKKYLPLIKKEVAWAAKYSDTNSRELCSWYYGPINMLLAEYTLATGDKTYLPDMKRISLEISAGQSSIGSWGHRFAKPNGRLTGYGMMNAPGLVLTTSLVLARKAGVDDPKVNEAIEKSVRLLRFYVGKGSVPYGDHPPFMKTHEDNGKNGIAALLFNILGDKEAASYFSRMALAAHGHDRDQGHTGNFFNILWAMPSVALSGPNATGQWMQEFSWYYDLGRKWDGSFQHQGQPQAKPDRFSNWDATGAFMLAYGQPLEVLQITGANSGLVDSLSAKEAASVVVDGQGYSPRNKENIYGDLSVEQLFVKLGSWSPIVRQRAAEALKRRKGNFDRPLNQYLRSKNTFQQLGACQAIAQLKGSAAGTIPGLRKLLKSDELWVRTSAAEALAGIGKKANVAVPQLLQMVTEIDRESDPRAMEQRYLTVALFSKRTGLLKHTLTNVDPQQFYTAVRSSLQNEDGHARGQVASIYKRLSFEELKPLMPAIYKAVVEPAPTGNMFADQIRISGLEVLAKHRVEEGMKSCLDLIELDRWGRGKRISRCLQSLQLYGTAAGGLAPELRAIRKEIQKKDKLNEAEQKWVRLVDETLQVVSGNAKPPKLRSLANLSN